MKRGFLNKSVAKGKKEGKDDVLPKAAIPSVATMAENIPHELIVDILSSLPAKSLVRFRCVCKPWCTLIADSNFIKKHLSRAMERATIMDLIMCQTKGTCGDLTSAQRDGDGFAYNMKNAFPFFQMHTDDIGYDMGIAFPFYHMHTHRVEGGPFEKAVKIVNPFQTSLPEISEVVGSCNGIVCLVHMNVVCLWNPCTREYKVVGFGEEFCMDRSTFYGFGYDPSSDDYKLVQVVNSDDDDSVYVYSLKDGSCSMVSDIQYEIENYYKEFGIFVNGAFHWVAYPKGAVRKVAVSFDIGEKVFREVPRPADLDPRSNTALGVLGGKLSLVCQTIVRGGIEIWVMKNYGQRDSWFKLITAEQRVYHSLVDAIDYRVLPIPLCFAKNGEAVLRVNGVLFLHDPKQETPRILEIHGLPDKIHRMVAYVPSLVSLKSGIYLRNILGVEGEEQV